MNFNIYTNDIVDNVAHKCKARDIMFVRNKRPMSERHFKSDHHTLYTVKKLDSQPYEW